MSNNLVITIGRQFGSGGRHIGKLVGEKLGIKVYDKELINLASEASGISRELLDSYDERPNNSLLYSLSLGTYSFENSIGGVPHHLPIIDKVFAVQSQVIRDIADKEPCVIIGRCADSILSGREKLLTVFIHADTEERIERVREYEKVSNNEASIIVKNADKKRASYHNYFSDNKWGVATSYDLCINSKIGFDRAADIIVDCANRF